MSSYAKSINCAVLTLALSLFAPTQADATGQIRLFLTSTLQGKFDLDTNHAPDPILKAGLSLLKEKETMPDLIYLDLGNAFYPGLLTRFSYGSLMYDFFTFFDCAASLVSSLDSRIGIDNLASLQDNHPGPLLSANILEQGKPVFNTFIVKTNNGEPVAYIGLSSSGVLPDIAERTLLKLDRILPRVALTNTLAALKRKRITRIILLTGLSTAEVLKIMGDYPEIGGAICGGDNPGTVSDISTERIILPDNRFILMLPRNKGYYIATLNLGKTGIVLDSLTFKQWTSDASSSNPRFQDFQKRLALWKNKFSLENGTLTDLDSRKYVISGLQAARLLRDTYKSEAAFISADTVTSRTLSGKVSAIGVYEAVSDEYNIYLFQLTGAELQTIFNGVPGLQISGFDGKKVQGVPVVDDRFYKVTGSQAVYELVQSSLERKVPFKNLWRNIPEIILDDMKTKRILTRNNFDYLDTRFRLFVQGEIAIPLSWSFLRIDPKVQIPAGFPDTAYRQWGLNGDGSISLYNKYHSLVLSLSLNLLDETIFPRNAPEALQLLNNSLNAAFLYTLNLSSTIQPYYKSAVQSAIIPVPGPTPFPVLLRNTIGGSLTRKYFTGQAGLGVEQNIHDPVTSPAIGLELIPSYNRNILKGLAYTLQGDVFLSVLNSGTATFQLKNQIDNSFQIAISQNISFVVEHKWLFFYTDRTKAVYSMQQLNVSINLNKSLKFF